MTVIWIKADEYRVVRDADQPVVRGHLSLSRSQMSGPVATGGADLPSRHLPEHGLRINPFHPEPPEAA